jgi:hypothetical protein
MLQRADEVFPRPDNDFDGLIDIAPRSEDKTRIEKQRRAFRPQIVAVPSGSAPPQSAPCA